MVGLVAHRGWTSIDSVIVLSANIAMLAAFVWWLIARKSRQMVDQLTARIDKLDELLSRVENEWRFQHRQGTYVGTLEGFWRVLQIGLDQGGLSPEMRRSIYNAGDEMFEAFHAETGRDRTGGVSQLWQTEQPESLYTHLAEPGPGRT